MLIIDPVLLVWVDATTQTHHWLVGNHVYAYTSTIDQTITEMLQLTHTTPPGYCVRVSCSICVMVWCMVDMYLHTRGYPLTSGAFISICGRVGNAVYLTQTWW